MDKPHLPAPVSRNILDSRKLPFQFSFGEKKFQNQRNLRFQFFSKTSNASSFIEGFIDWFFWCGRFNNSF
jgi:hypothetical protein